MIGDLFIDVEVWVFKCLLLRGRQLVPSTPVLQQSLRSGKLIFHPSDIQ